MELQGHWNPGVMQSLTPNQKIPSFLGWFPFPNVAGRQGHCPARCSAAATASRAR